MSKNACGLRGQGAVQSDPAQGLGALRPAECDAFTEMQGMLLGFLCHNRDQEIFQKDLEEAFYIRRSTASRLLKRLEEEGFVMRCSVSRDARLKQVMATPKRRP